jgi:hypothetical protein
MFSNNVNKDYDNKIHEQNKPRPQSNIAPKRPTQPVSNNHKQQELEAKQRLDAMKPSS